MCLTLIFERWKVEEVEAALEASPAVVSDSPAVSFLDNIFPQLPDASLLKQKGQQRL